MKLKKVIVAQFLSYSEEQTININNNMLGNKYSIIVGPNATGKSNLIRAIRFVLEHMFSDANYTNGSDWKLKEGCKVQLEFELSEDEQWLMMAILMISVYNNLNTEEIADKKALEDKFLELKKSQKTNGLLNTINIGHKIDLRMKYMKFFLYSIDKKGNRYDIPIEQSYTINIKNKTPETIIDYIYLEFISSKEKNESRYKQINLHGFYIDMTSELYYNSEINLKSIHHILGDKYRNENIVKSFILNVLLKKIVILSPSINPQKIENNNYHEITISNIIDTFVEKNLVIDNEISEGIQFFLGLSMQLVLTNDDPYKYGSYIVSKKGHGINEKSLSILLKLLNIPDIQFYIKNASQGTIEIILILAALHLYDAETFLLDELGANLHPMVRYQLREWISIKCKNVSILIITHAPELLPNNFDNIYKSIFDEGSTKLLSISTLRDKFKKVSEKHKTLVINRDKVKVKHGEGSTLEKINNEISNEEYRMMKEAEMDGNRMYTFLIEPNFREILFSKRVLFVEGFSDLRLLKAFDLYLQNCHNKFINMNIVSLEGSTNLYEALWWSKNLKMDNCFLLDGDVLKLGDKNCVVIKGLRDIGKDVYNLETLSNTSENMEKAYRFLQDNRIFLWKIDLEEMIISNPPKELMDFIKMKKRRNEGRRIEKKTDYMDLLITLNNNLRNALDEQEPNIHNILEKLKINSSELLGQYRLDNNIDNRKGDIKILHNSWKDISFSDLVSYCGFLETQNQSFITFYKFLEANKCIGTISNVSINNIKNLDINNNNTT